MKFVKLTGYGGDPIYVAPQHVVAFYSYDVSLDPDIRTAIVTVESDKHTLVCEDIYRVRDLLEQAA